MHINNQSPPKTSEPNIVRPRHLFEVYSTFYVRISSLLENCGKYHAPVGRCFSKLLIECIVEIHLLFSGVSIIHNCMTDCIYNIYYLYSNGSCVSALMWFS